MPSSAAPRRKRSVLEALSVAARALGRAAIGALPRLYALGMIAIIAYLSYHAFRYLAETLFVPSEAPAQVADLPRRMDPQSLLGARPDWTGLSAVENPRTPPSHYHRFDLFIQADAFNDCTRSGCHAPLPHAERKEVRAFLNMHATSIHCGVCHFQDDSSPLALTWYDLRSGAPRGAPALLAAVDWLEKRAAAPVREGTPQEQREIVTLLRQAVADGGGGASLERVADHLRAVRPRSPAFEELLGAARETTARAMRGHYGAKLAVRGADGRPLLAHPNTESAARALLREGVRASPERREELVRAVHPKRREAALDCTACHRAEGSRVDFPALGYAAGRIRALSHPAVFQMIENISKGRPFRLPQAAPAREP